MNGLGTNNASKNDKGAAILTPDEVALLRTHASDGTLTAMPDKSEVDVLGLRVARALITVALVMLALPFVISAFQFWMYMHPSLS